MRGFILGAVLLTVLDAVVSSTAAAQRASTLLSIPTAVITYIVSPEKPAIPDLRKRATSTTTGPADNPFAAAVANQQVVAASWSTASTAPSAPPVQSTAEYLLGVST